MVGKKKASTDRPERTTVAVPSFEMLLDQPVTVTENGVERQFTTEEALQQRVVQSAFAGRRRDIATILTWVRIREEARAPRKSKIPAARIRHETGDPQNIDDALLVLGIARERQDPRIVAKHERQLLLEPWCVQAALSRRTGDKLGPKDVKEIKHSTRDAASLRWPGD